MKIQNKKQMDQLSNQDSVFLSIDEGETRVRIIGDIYAVLEHGIEIEGKRRNIACPTENVRKEIQLGLLSPDTEIPTCPLCELGYPVKAQYLAFTLVREKEEDGKLVPPLAGVLKKGPSLLGKIQNYLESSDWGNAGNYDFKILATGKDLKRRYEVNPVPVDKSPEFNDRERMVIERAKERVDLDKMTTPLPYSKIKEEIGEKYPSYEPKASDDIPF